MPQQLKHESRKVSELIDDYCSGRIVIPEFQRGYVWKPNKAALLMDSLYQGFPISSLLIWQSHEAVNARPYVPKPSRISQVNWLIDGQQRVRTLHHISTGEIPVIFNPELEQFRLPSAATRNDRSWIAVNDIWDKDRYHQLVRNSDSGSAAERWHEKLATVRNLLNYEVPAVCMLGHRFEQAVNVFERINTQGAKLKGEDIQSAKVAARHTGFIASEVAPFLKTLVDSGFSRINVMHLFRACAFVATPDGRNKTPLHELEPKEINAAWKKTKMATEEAIRLVRSELGLFNMDVLRSGSLLVPLIAICARQNQRERDVPGMMGWLALASVCHRYSGASETALEQDLRACKTADPIGALLKNLKDTRESLKATPLDFSGSLADRSGQLAVFIACKHRGLLDMFSKAKVLSQGSVDRHHILPRAQFAESLRPSADGLANIAFISSAANKSIGLTGPEVYLKTISRKVLESQCIPVDESLWRIDAHKEFWEQRKQLLATAFNDFVRASLPDRRLGLS